MSTDQPVPSFPTSLGTSEGTSITLLGQDLATDLMGHVSFGELAYWLITLRRPTPQQARLFEAVLLGLADHGFTPTAIAARLTYLSAPDAIQGALAAGILGGGSRFLGVTEDTGRFLAGILEATDPRPADDAGWDALAGGRWPIARPRASSCPAWATRCTRRATRARRGSSASPARRACTGRTWPCSRPSAACTRRSSASACRSTAPASAAPPWPTWACRWNCSAAWCCWPAAPGCSGTSPRKSAGRSPTRST